MSSWRPNLHSGFELCENGAILSKRYQNMGTILSRWYLRADGEILKQVRDLSFDDTD